MAGEALASISYDIGLWVACIGVNDPTSNSNSGLHAVRDWDNPWLATGA